jgi:hypothetical protein
MVPREFSEGKIIYYLISNRIGSLIGGMFQKTNQSPMPNDKRSNLTSQITTPKGIQSVGSGSHESSRAMSIVIPAETTNEIEKYDRFLIQVSYINLGKSFYS